VTDRPSVTCPKCARTSYNVQDVLHGYCGACDAYHGDPSVPSLEELKVYGLNMKLIQRAERAETLAAFWKLWATIYRTSGLFCWGLFGSNAAAQLVVLFLTHRTHPLLVAPYALTMVLAFGVVAFEVWRWRRGKPAAPEL
jgi:hypothetical protein